MGRTFQHRENIRSRAPSPKQLLQIALHLSCTRRQYHSVGDMRGVSRASICKAVRDVVAAVNKKILPQWVRWPRKSLVYSDRGRYIFFQALGPAISVYNSAVSSAESPDLISFFSFLQPLDTPSVLLDIL
jgi:hypothetical protein